MAIYGIIENKYFTNNENRAFTLLRKLFCLSYTYFKSICYINHLLSKVLFSHVSQITK